MYLSNIFNELFHDAGYVQHIALIFEVVLLFHLFKCNGDFSFRLIRFSMLCECLTIFCNVIKLHYVALTGYDEYCDDLFLLYTCARAVFHDATMTAHISIIIERFIYICMPRVRQIIVDSQKLQWTFYSVCIILPVFYLSLNFYMTQPNARYFYSVCELVRMLSHEYATMAIITWKIMFVILLLVRVRYHKRLTPAERTRTNGVLILESAVSVQVLLKLIAWVIFEYKWIHRWLPFLIIYSPYHICFSWVYLVAIEDVRTIFWTKVLRRKLKETTTSSSEDMGGEPVTSVRFDEATLKSNRSSRNKLKRFYGLSFREVRESFYTKIRRGSDKTRSSEEHMEESTQEANTLIASIEANETTDANANKPSVQTPTV